LIGDVKTFLTSLAVVALLVGGPISLRAGSSQTAPHPLLSVEARRYAAMVAANREALEPLLSDDLSYIHSNGIRETKAQFLDAVQAGDIRYTSIQPTETLVRDEGRWAMLTGVVRMTVVLGGKEQSARLFYTAIYERTRPGWQLVSWQTTRAATP
jgi:hypothetical protein